MFRGHRQDKQKSEGDPNVSSSEASTSGEAIPVSEVSQEDKKAEKAGGLKQGSPSSGESESSVGSSSESGSESDHNRSNDGANGAGPDDRNQVFITIETPLFVRSHYVYLPKKKKTEDADKEEDKDDSDAGPSTADPSVGKQEDAGPSKRKYSSDSESESEGKTPPSYKRQKRESDSEEISAAERLQRGFRAVSENVVKRKDPDYDDKERTVDQKNGRSETKTESEKERIQRPSGYNVDNMEEQKDSSKAATLKRPLEDDDSRQESPKRRRQSSDPNAGHHRLKLHVRRGLKQKHPKELTNQCLEKMMTQSQHLIKQRWGTRPALHHEDADLSPRDTTKMLPSYLLRHLHLSSQLQPPPLQQVHL
ncbi:PREDICTED: HIV Tat-specific factor 1 homolog [Branchiostoma belcheri]|uniref:HIV Tat-specific factor 1 homolog n=1 Tax=Branchiostoma belcheri TaxID=7741 RepID=A0A6P4Z1V8_BRABE|nr:PREDICTED: HIV Tat-specific factor 1 homolog [Branchiostoma belcheri]